MTQEYMPKGFSNWTQYWLGSKRRALKENLKVLAVVTLIFLAYCIVGYMEY